MYIRILTIAILIGSYLFSLFTHFLCAKQRTCPLPKAVADLYSKEDYAKWCQYETKRARVGLLDEAVNLIISLLLLATPIPAKLFALIGVTGFWGEWLFLALYLLLCRLIAIPTSYWVDMRIESQYGFNKSTGKTFILDQVKNLLVEELLIGALFSIVWGFGQMQWTWKYPAAFLAVTALIALISTFGLLTQKLFNKFTPLEDSQLKTRLGNLFAESGYTVKAFWVMDASRRTTKVNAFCIGMGKFKEIVLYDNLVNNYSEDEILAVFAHELSHYKHRDTLKLTAINACIMGLLIELALLLCLSDSVGTAFGFTQAAPGFAFAAVTTALFGPVFTVLRLPANLLSRRAEYRADAFAATNGYGAALQSSLKKISHDNFADVNPHPLIIALMYSHPTLAQRLGAIDVANGSTQPYAEA